MVDQTILASDPKRPGNCVSACVATFLAVDLEQVPHFLEYGKAINGTNDKVAWWACWYGFMAAHGYQMVQLASVDYAETDEVVFVAGMSSRDVLHQVLYRNGALWHDPHPSKEGVLDIREVLAFRRASFDHSPTDQEKETD